MAQTNTILVVDDNQVNRKILWKILSGTYEVIEAENGKEALEILEVGQQKISGIILDLLMPVMNGYELLKIISQDERLCNIPIIVATGDCEAQNEIHSLSLGAWDFVLKPYNEKVIKFRLKNAILRSEMSIFNQLKYMSEYDELTGIYNKKMFCKMTGELINYVKDGKFTLIRFDVDRFKLINSFFGQEQGDVLLKYIASKLKKICKNYKYTTYGRMEADIFAVCISVVDKKYIINEINRIKEYLLNYNLDFNISFTYGMYQIEDTHIPIDIMIDRATLAAKEVKGNYINNYMYYSKEMGEKLEKEQEIVNEMGNALRNQQFVVYFQPKYDVGSNLPTGAEALVRWKHPTKGMISPGEFIPIFERNDFITKIDYFVWEKVCRIIKNWKKSGMKILPVSVNISRANLYNPKLVNTLCELTDKYNINREMFQLELTESMYTENPEIISKTVDMLHKKGFTIFMDDFGSGYSSLNLLKNLNIDVLKIDMEFFKDSNIPGRAENIVAAVVRMAKWLGLQTVAEGVEKIQQVDFLREIGCEYIQGYYYARPMPHEEYEKLINKYEVFKEERNKSINLDSLWVNNPQMELLFTEMLQAVAIYEIDGDKVEILRANQQFYRLFDYKTYDYLAENPLNLVSEEYKQTVKDTINQVSKTKGTAECVYKRICTDNTYKWIRTNLKYVNSVGNKTIMLGIITNITQQREIEDELNKYRAAIVEAEESTNTMLIVDDTEMNRVILEEMFNDKYTILQAENGREALDILKNHNVDIILLDLFMPVMSGTEFLNKKNEDERIKTIPTVIITADDSRQQQIDTLNLGADDYILKPFIKEIVLKRVDNVLKSRINLGEVLKECSDVL